MVEDYQLDQEGLRALIKNAGKGCVFRGTSIPEEVVKNLIAKQYASNPDAKIPKYYSCYNYKGGIGKTALTAGLGLALSKRGKKVLLVDADPQSSLSIQFLGWEIWHKAGENSASIWNAFDPLEKKDFKRIGDPSLVASGVRQLESPFSNGGEMSLLVGSPRIATLEASVAFGDKVKEFQRQSIQVYYGIPDYAVSRNFDYVIFDAPPSFTLSSIAILLVADKVIAPIDDDLSTLYGLWMFDGLRDNVIKNSRIRGNIVKEREFQKAVARCTHAVPSRVENLQELKSQWEAYRGSPIWREILGDINLVTPGIPFNRNISDTLREGEPSELAELEEFKYFENTANQIFPL